MSTAGSEGYEFFRDRFLEGKDGENTFKAHLLRMGFPRNTLESEVNLARMGADDARTADK